MAYLITHLLYLILIEIRCSIGVCVVWIVTGRRVRLIGLILTLQIHIHVIVLNEALMTSS